ncbi:MAG: MFS transporter, partial [bacterium]
MFGILGFNVGVIYLYFIILNVMPNFESHKITLVYIWTVVPMVVFLIYIILFAEDSPRSLIRNGQIDQGLKILEKMNRKPLTEEEKTNILESLNILKSGDNVKAQTSV